MKKHIFRTGLSVFLTFVCISASAGIAVQGLRRYDVSTEDALEFSREIADFAMRTEGATPECNVVVHTNGTRPDFRALHAEYTIEGPDDTYIACFETQADALSAVETANELSGVLLAETGHTVEAQEMPDAGNLSWGIESMHLDKLKAQIEETGKPVQIAVIDSGIDLTHPIFENATISGTSFIAESYDTDQYGHGTSVAGLITEILDGLPFELTMLKILDATGKGDSVIASKAIENAVENGAQVINLSFVIASGCSKDIDKAVKNAVNQNVIPVVSAGNQRKDLNTHTACPVHLTEPIVVSGCTQADTFYAASNYGSTIDICAPGSAVFAPFPGSLYTSRNGTSFAAPHIVAIYAMFLMLFPDAGMDYLTAMLYQNTRDLGDVGYDTHFGWGIPDFSEPLRSPTDIRIRAISVLTLPDKTQYHYKDSFDSTGFSLEALYSDGTRKPITEGITFTHDKLTRGDHKVYAHYETFSTAFDIHVEFYWWQWIIWIPLLGFLWY